MWQATLRAGNAWTVDEVKWFYAVNGLLLCVCR